MNTAILYCSRHHGNTKKLLDAIAQRHPVTLIDASAAPCPDLSVYDRIGLASGVYYSGFDPSIRKAAESLPAGKQVFFLYTCGSLKGDPTRALARLVEARGSRVAGWYGCLGYDTFGPFRLIGGLAKGHPTPEEVEQAVRFYESLSPAD